MPRINPSEPGSSAAAVEAALLAKLFATLLPALIMSLLFAGVGAVIVWQARGVFLPTVYVLGLFCSVARLGVMLRFRRGAAIDHSDRAWARRIAWWFDATYAAFALLVGTFAAGAASLAPREPGMLAAILVTGYAAGVSTGVAARPRLAVAAMLLGVLPLAVAHAIAGTLVGWTLAIMLAAFLVGGVRSTLVRGRDMADEIAMRIRYAALARHDHLTGLPNRLALDEYLAELARSGEQATIFCADLDRFKPVNDRHGHVAGDAVLREMGRRFSALLRPSDLVTRVGGDEFVLVCRGTASDHARDALVSRIGAAAADAIIVSGQSVVVGASVGASIVEAGSDPRTALERADEALCRAKAAGREGDYAPAPIGPGTVVPLPTGRRPR